MNLYSYFRMRVSLNNQFSMTKSPISEVHAEEWLQSTYNQDNRKNIYLFTLYFSNLGA